LTFLTRIFGSKAERAELRPLYEAVVSAGRDPVWYRQGRVPDTIDGRFDLIAAILSLVLLRLERDGEGAQRQSVLLAEHFIADMEGTVRELGIGDVVVGKHVGRMMGALGGRLGAYRVALASGGNLGPPVRRNIFRDSPPDEEAVAIVASRLQAFEKKLAETSVDDLIGGELPSR
jgi:cytochrome b pre-mRNA-processing protein 3